MNILIWSLITFIGAVAGLGELAYVRYWAGESIGEAILFDAGLPQVHAINIAESDFPIRLNIDMRGSRQTTDIAFHSFVTLKTGGQAECDTLAFEAAIDKEDDLAEVSVGSDNFKLKPGWVPNLARSSQLFQCGTPGKWNLSAAVSDEGGYEMQQISAVIKRNSRTINWFIAGTGLLALLIGFVMLIAALRQKYPNLAT